MDLFVRESGPVGAPAIVFLHGAYTSGWSWEPVVERMQQYRCLVPDLPHYGKSFEQGPFEMGRAAAAVAELIRSRVDTGRAHLVGLSLGAQVGVQLLATEPKLVDRAVLCGTVINRMPFVPVDAAPAGTARPELDVPLDGAPLPECLAVRRFPRPISMTIAKTYVSNQRTARRRHHGVRGVHAPRGTRPIGFAHIVPGRRQGDAGRTPLGFSARAANAQRSRQGRPRYAP